MAKRLFLLPLCLLYGVLNVSPLTSIEDSQFFDNVSAIEEVVAETATETTAAQDEQNGNLEAKSALEEIEIASLAETPNIITPAATYVAPQADTTPTSVPDRININGRTVNIWTVNDTAQDAGNHADLCVNNTYCSTGSFLYGHNSSSVFGSLRYMNEGDTFTVTLNNQTTTYRIKKMVIFEKNTSNGKLQLNGSGSYMASVAKSKYDGVKYDFSIMTCHGTSLGNGDATHRLVIFADRI